MRFRMLETLCVLLAATVWCAVSAQSSNFSPWVGVWQGELDGQPSVVLTLAEDTGTLEGTLVLNIINRDGGQPHVIAHEPHVLMQLRRDGSTLSFQLKRIDGSTPPMEFTVKLAAPNSATIHCLNCGEDAPTVAIIKVD